MLATNACAANPCQNGGTCQNQGALAYVCVCPDEASGTNCEKGRFSKSSFVMKTRKHAQMHLPTTENL